MADEMTTSEVARRLEDVVREVRELTGRMLMREVYDAHRESMQARIATLESDKTKGRWMVYGLAGTFLVTTIAQILVTLLAR